jgi:hypothetical protein
VISMSVSILGGVCQDLRLRGMDVARSLQNSVVNNEQEHWWDVGGKYINNEPGIRDGSVAPTHAPEP